MRQNALLAMALFLVATVPTAVVAAGPPDMLVPQFAEVSISPTVAEWVPVVGNLSFRLSISGPRGLTLDREFTAGEVPTLAAWDEQGRSLPDGVYEYELRAVSSREQQRKLVSPRTTAIQVSCTTSSASSSRRTTRRASANNLG